MSAPDGSLSASLWTSVHAAKTPLNSGSGGGEPGRSPRSGSVPFLVRTDDPKADTSILTASERQTLLGSITGRDLAILSALHHYRYLDRGQLESLFFPSTRSCQTRLKWLSDHHLAHRWLRLQQPGWRRCDSVLLITPRGASVLAGHLGVDAKELVHRSRGARDHSLYLTHDLEANGFFVALARASAPIPDQGLYHWVGEESTRVLYRGRGEAPSPDGWGRYLLPQGEVVFLLEWDRGTQSPQRLRQKISIYLDHFRGRQDAHLNHVLLVGPNWAREQTIAEATSRLRPAAGAGCRLWTSNQELLAEAGPLGPVWLDPASPSRRSRLSEFDARPRSARRVEDSIAKPAWWERRPGGGEGA